MEWEEKIWGFRDWPWKTNPLARHPKEWRHLDVSCFFCRRDKVGEGNNRLLSDESFVGEIK